MAHHGLPRYRVVLCGNYGVGKTTLFQRFVVDSLDSDDRKSAFVDDETHSRHDEQVTSSNTSHSKTRRSRQCIGIDTFCRQFSVSDGRAVQLELCDTGGMERYNSLSVSYFARALAIIVCYSLIDCNSFTAVANHIVDAVENAYRRTGGADYSRGTSTRTGTGRGSIRSPVAVFLCGTKSDQAGEELVSEEISPKKAVTQQMVRTLLTEFDSIILRSFTVSARTGNCVTSMFQDIASILVDDEDIADRNKKPSYTASRIGMPIDRHDSQTLRQMAASSGGGKRINMTAYGDNISKQLRSCCHR